MSDPYFDVNNVCRSVNGKITPCTNLKQSINALNYPNGDRGIHLIQVLSNGKHQEDMFTVKNYDDEHRQMKFCPFCGYLFASALGSSKNV